MRQIDRGAMAAVAVGAFPEQQGPCSTFREDEMQITRWTRRHVLKAAAGAAAV